MSANASPRPEDRFAGPVDVIDLDRHAQDLHTQLRESGREHTQTTLYRHDRATVAIFALRAGHGLPPHELKGIVTVLVRTGVVRIHINNDTHELTPNQLLRLAPDVSHDLVAVEDATVILHFVLTNH